MSEVEWCQAYDMQTAKLESAEAEVHRLRVEYDAAVSVLLDEREENATLRAKLAEARQLIVEHYDGDGPIGLEWFKKARKFLAENKHDGPSNGPVT